MKNALSNPGSFIAGRMPLRRYAAVVSLVLGLVSPSAQAASGTWNVDAAGNWSTTTNWLGGTVPGGAAGDVANLTFNLTAARTVTVDGTNKTIGVLNIGDSDNTASYTLGGAVSIFYNNGASDAQINQTATSKGDTISAPISIIGNGNLTITNASVNTLTMGAYTSSGSAGAKTLTVNSTGAVNYTGALTNGSGSLALVKSGTGALTISGDNNYTGDTTLNAGTLNIATYNGHALGTGAFTINGGTIDNTYGGALTLTYNNVQNWNANIVFTGTQSLNLGTGAVTMNASRTVTVTANTLTVGGGIAGTGFALTKAGSGTLVLNGANTYTGATTINGGVLSAATLANGGVSSAIGASANAAANLVINGSTLRYTGAGVSTDRSFTLGTTPGSALDASGTGAVTITGACTLSGTNTARTLTLTGSNAGSNTLAAVIVNNGTGATSLVKSGSGQWVLTGTNTYTGSTALSAGTLAINNASAIGTGALTITGGALDNTSGSPVTLATNNAQNWNVNFSFTGTNALNLGTGAVAMNASRTVTVTASTLTIGGVMSGSTFGLTLAGAGTLDLNGANTYTGATTINGGILSAATLANGGVSSAIGASSNAAANLVLNGGTLQYVGATASTDRSFTLGTTAGSTLDASGSGAITFTGSCTLAGTNTARTLTLTGSNAGSNTLAAAITDNGTGATSLVKSGSGSWVLTGVNTYTGGTTITGGTLTTFANGALGSGSLSITGGSLVLAATGPIGSGDINITGGSLALANASAFKSNATLTFSPLMAPGSITLNFTGTAVLSSLSNGTLHATAGTYTAAQLNTVFSTSVFTGIGSITVGSWVTVPLGGGGFVSGLACNSTGSDIYCRTDVGGAFRWVPAVDGLNGSWLSITDTLVPTNAVSDGATNISSIAVDPTNANNLYVAVGQPGSTVTGIYASTDRGATWTKVNPANPIVMDGNGTYRGVGERLAIDPNSPNIVWFGSTRSGLWKGTQTAGNWSWTQISASLVPFGVLQQVRNSSGVLTTPTSLAGVTFVACDPNGGSTILYAGVFNNLLSGSTGGVYRSVDGGVSWAPLTPPAGVTFTTPVRGQVGPNGTLYVTSATVMNTSVYPATLVNYGAVAKMARGGSALVAITPPSGNTGYQAIAVDPNNSPSDLLHDIVYVSQCDTSLQYNKIWRSADSGVNWIAQYQNLNDNRTIARSEPDGTRTLTGYWFAAPSALLVNPNPSNPNELWASDYFGVARTRNAQLLGGAAIGNQAIWYMLQKNQEEVYVETIKNAPTGPELMIGVADVGGYRYNDISQRPYGQWGNSFSNPSDKNTTSLDFHEPDINHNIWVRVWDSGTYGTGAQSKDGGVTWIGFGELDRHVINSGPAGWETWDLTTYLKTQQAMNPNAVVTLIVSSETGYNTTYSYGSYPQYFSSKEDGTVANRPYISINGSTSLPPTDDTTADGANPTTVNGGSLTLGVCSAFGNDSYEKQAYLKFNLSGMPTITSASLKLYRQLDGLTGTTIRTGIYACSNTSWSETTLVYNGRPNPYASSVGKPTFDPRYTTAAGVSLSGGRVAISSTNPDNLVWMPLGHTTVPHYSNDRGVTWTPCAGLPTNVNWMLSQSNPSYLLQQLTADRVNGNFYIEHLYGSPSPKLIYRSTDGGANWTQVGSIPYGPSNYNNNVWRTQIVAAPAAGHVWVTDDGITDPTMGGLWMSSDGGVTSPQIANVSGVRVVAFGKPNPAVPGKLYSTYFMGYYNSVKGIYRSDDYGATWTALPALPSDISVESIAGDRQTFGSVFIGTGGRGVFQTQ